MRNTKGIILNGEWLGNNVIVNEMFNVIFAISPIVMQEFLRVVNGIEELEDAVHINNFNYNNKNVIDIEFSNNELSGLASLLFKTKNGSHELVDCFLKVDRDKDKEPVQVEPKKKAPKAKKAEKEVKQGELVKEEIKEELPSKIEVIEEIESDKFTDEIKQEEQENEQDNETVEIVKEASADETEIKKKIKDELKNELKNEIKDIKAELKTEIDAVKAQTKVQKQQATAVETKETKEVKEVKSAGKKPEGGCPFANIASCFNNICQATNDLANKIKQPTRAVAPAPAPVQVAIPPQPRQPRQVEPAPQPAPRVGRVQRQEVVEPRPVRRPQPYAQQAVPPQPQAQPAPQPVPQPQPFMQPVKEEVRTVEDVKATVVQNSSLLSEEEQRAMIEEIKKLKEQIEILRRSMDEKELAKLEAEQAKSMLDRFIETQKKKAESKADTYGFTFRIVGSDKSMNADVVDESVFIAGDKIYKWGEKLYLEN